MDTKRKQYWCGHPIHWISIHVVYCWYLARIFLWDMTLFRLYVSLNAVFIYCEISSHCCTTLALAKNTNCLCPPWWRGSDMCIWLLLSSHCSCSWIIGLILGSVWCAHAWFHCHCFVPVFVVVSSSDGTYCLDQIFLFFRKEYNRIKPNARLT